MYYATIMMHKPEDHPKNSDPILILIKGETNFKVGSYHNVLNTFSVLDDGDECNYKPDMVDMWCEMPTRQTVNKVSHLWCAG